MKKTLLSIPVHRPVATSMFFLALALLGTFSWFKFPIELIPASSGEQLYVKYYRPSSDPGVLEREILIPLESRIKQLPGITKTWGEITGSSGALSIEFEPGSNYRIRELELRRIAADLVRSQPEGTVIRVSSQDTSALSRYVMSIQVLGGGDSNALRDLVKEQIQPQVEAIESVSQVFVFGGANREVTVLLDPNRCAELGVKMTQVSDALRRSVGEIVYLGNTKEEHRRISVLIDDRPEDLTALGNIRVTPELPVLINHVAEIKMSTAPQQSVSRVNGQPSVSLVVFQDQGANVVQLGQKLRKKLASLRQQFKRYSLDLVISFDASQKIEEQLSHLKKLATAGFIIALLVLYLFLRDVRAVAVVAIAVPMSLLVAGALLYLSGYSLNLFTLFGLVIGVGMLVDNSIVVHEAVQRNLERGVVSDVAATAGIQRTVRAIITASSTNAIVFLPIIYIQEIPLSVRLVLENIVPAILFPLAASLLVAIGLVPLLAQKLAAPAILARMQSRAIDRQYSNNNATRNPARELFSALIKDALRHPSKWVIGVFAIVLLTIIFALPWVLVQSISQPAADAEQVRIEVEFDGGGSLDAANQLFRRLERSALNLKGVQRVESNYQEDLGTLTVYLEPLENNSQNVNAAEVRRVINSAVRGLDNIQLQLMDTNSNNTVSATGTSGADSDSSQIAISGPNMAQLNRLAEQLKAKLLSSTLISSVTVNSHKSREEFFIQTDPSALAAHQLYSENALETLISIGREGLQMPRGFNSTSSREIPIYVRRIDYNKSNILKKINNLPVLTGQGVLSLSELADSKRSIPPLAIAHQNGRRELRVAYRLSEIAPKTGPERKALEKQIENHMNNTYMPEGYTIELIGSVDSTDWFKLVFIPILLLLYALLAISFESLTLPILILITVPLTIFGSVWALFIAGLGVNMMAIVGVIVLLGLTVNPAILLVDRMQQKLRVNTFSEGKAAMAAARERVRPVLMTSCTTIAGLWPLAMTSGRGLEIWPPFATVVMGGLVTSTLLTLLVIPIGFVLLARIDKIILDFGPWKSMSIPTITAVLVLPLILGGHLESFGWQVVTTTMTFVAVFMLFVRLFYRQKEIEINSDNMVVETRYLSKIYGQRGPLIKALQKFITLSRQQKLKPIIEYRETLLAHILLSSASIYLVIKLQSIFWQITFAYLTGFFILNTITNLNRLLNLSSSINVIKPNLFSKIFNEQNFKFILPWLILSILTTYNIFLPALGGHQILMHWTIVVLLILITSVLQLGRSHAKLINQGTMALKIKTGRLQSFRTRWRKFCLNILAMDLPNHEFTALSSINFRAESGLIGILGPNGAGKTTLIRLLASVLDSSAGTIYYANVEKRKIGHKLAKLIGYLPQEFGLPDHLTAREYLNYFALLYEVGTQSERELRVSELLEDVGLAQNQNQKISSYSGGMRQRVAIARTLLLHPPFIIVDEPTAGLDPRERIRFRNLLAKLAKKRVVLFSTHVVEDVEAACDRVIVLKSGSIVFDGKPEKLAELAKNKIWQVILPPLQVNQFGKQHNIVNQLLNQDNKINLRILADDKPHQQANVVESSLEDGYFQLFNEVVSEDE